MRVYDAKNLKYQDKLAEKRRRVYILKTLFFISLAIAIVGFVLYLLFFSELLEVSQVNVNGLDKVSGEKFSDEVNRRLNSKWLGLFENQRNVIFFDSDTFMAEALAVFPEIKDIFVSKEPPHVLNIDVVERAIAGVWCFIDSGSTPSTSSGQAGFITNCRYFDKEGVMWGQTVRSLGFLILVVEDMRPKGSGTLEEEYLTLSLDRELLSIIMLISERLKKDEIFIHKFIIPDKFIDDFSAFTSGGYELLFSTDVDIETQIKVLEIFLAEKKDDPDFKPQYIDLRVNGRIYYK